MRSWGSSATVAQVSLRRDARPTSFERGRAGTRPGRARAPCLSFPRMRPKAAFRLALVIVALALLVAVALPLWQPLLLGGVLAAALTPAHDWLSARLHGRRSLAAAILLAGVVLLILAPLAWVISVAVRETAAGIAFVRDTLQTHGPEAFLSRLPGWMAGPIRSLLGSVSTSAEELAGFAAKRGVATAAAVGTALGATAQALAQTPPTGASS